MVTIEHPVYQFPFDDENGSALFQTIINLAETREIARNGWVTRQFWHADEFFVLLEGEVEFSIHLEDIGEEVAVGRSGLTWTPMGWSGLRAPHRYATTITCLQSSVFYVWKRETVESFLLSEPKFGAHFLYIALQASAHLLGQTLALIKLNQWDLLTLPSEPTTDIPPPIKLSDDELESFLLRSPFFEVFPPLLMKRLALVGEVIEVEAGQRIFHQGETASELVLLYEGRFELFYEAPLAMIRSEDKNQVFFRSLTNPGQVIGWASALGGCHGSTAVAVRRSRVCRFSQQELNRLTDEDPDFGLHMAKRLLWLLSNHLRTARVRLVSQGSDREVVAIRNLIDQSSPQLSVNSNIHKVPLLLNDRLTLEDGLRCLEKLLEEGSSLERSLASLCLDLLREVRKESEVFNGLREAYETVVTAPPELSHFQVRERCNQAFRKTFEICDYRILGQENLPEHSGHIFILNHLDNHPFNTLPNNFQLTLDCHFICSMILSIKYDSTSIRVVRRSRGDEYGHQDYYDRLGHIYVQANESEPSANKSEQQENRQAFFDIAAEHLSAGRNLIICPEETSCRTADSPGQFKPGAFRLAASLSPEPFIVPLVVANFDRRLNRTTLIASVQRPFRVTERMQPGNREQMAKFLADLHGTYKSWVEEARNLTG